MNGRLAFRLLRLDGDAVEQVVERDGVDLDVLLVGSDGGESSERSAVKALVIGAASRAVEEDDLHRVATAAEEDEARGLRGLEPDALSRVARETIAAKARG